MLAIARELDRIGYECFLSVAQPYADLVRSAGFHANVVIDEESFHRISSQDEFWRPWSGARRVLAELADQFFLPHLQFIDAMHQGGRTVLVSHPLDYASRVFRETSEEVKLSSVHLAPAMMRHEEFPPRLLPDRGGYPAVLPPGWSRWNRLTYFLADHVFLDRVLGPSINQERHRRGGLPRQRRLLHRWWHSPDQMLALYPAWFAPEIAARYAEASEQSAALQCVGFPLDDGILAASAPREDLPSDRPLLLTTGTAHHGDKNFVSRVAELCQNAGVAVLWCCPSNPTAIPHPNIRSVGYIALGEWLPHCRAIIHHGGIGTTSRAIDAGIPQMIRPLAFDQFDNASRVERFGLGIWLRRDRELSSAIEQLLQMTPPPVSRSEEQASAAERAATLIDTLL